MICGSEPCGHLAGPSLASYWSKSVNLPVTLGVTALESCALSRQAYKHFKIFNRMISNGDTVGRVPSQTQMTFCKTFCFTEFWIIYKICLVFCHATVYQSSFLFSVILVGLLHLSCVTDLYLVLYHIPHGKKKLDNWVFFSV